MVLDPWQSLDVSETQQFLLGLKMFELECDCPNRTLEDMKEIIKFIPPCMRVHEMFPPQFSPSPEILLPAEELKSYI